MGVYFNKNNISSLNDCIDCRCSISTNKIVDGQTKKIVETKVVKSAYYKKDGQIVKLWERKVQVLPQFLILGSSYSLDNNHHIKTMYVSDDMLSYKTLCTYGAVSSTTTNHTHNESEYISESIGLLKDTEYVGSLNGEFLGTINCLKDGTSSVSEHIGILTYVSKDNWKWEKWDKTGQFPSSKLHKVVTTDTNTVIFITGESESGIKYQYFSKDNGDTWIQLSTVTYSTFNVNYKYGYFFIFTGRRFFVLNESDIENWNTELFNNSGNQPNYGGQKYVDGVWKTIPNINENAVIAMTKNIWFAFSDDSGNGVFYTADKGTTWQWETSNSTYKNNDVKSIVDNGEEMYLANIGVYSIGESSKPYKISASNNCMNWHEVNQNININFGFNKNDKVGYLKSIDRFVAISSSKQMLYLLENNSTDINITFNITLCSVPEQNVTVIEK